MIHKFKILYVMLFLLTISNVSCGSSKVVAEEDPNTNFQAYKTFVICAEDLLVKDTNYPEYDNTTTRMHIKTALEDEMRKRGYELEASSPQLQVGFKFTVKDEEVSITNCFDEDEYSYWAGCKIETYNYAEQSLIIYVSDLEKNQIIWQGSIIKGLTMSPEKFKKTINRTIAKIFKEYPI
ncbi:DUF4136 domain-containing protein [Ascidiimonas sp. W6]|uniref:DUF4136 domain-containing protein n=1 Tax=Ascidiimonas meishanensis TaxID=3128903 RepID=UPI0030ECCD37